MKRGVIFRSTDADKADDQEFAISVFSDQHGETWVGIQIGIARAGMDPVGALRLAGALVAAAEDCQGRREPGKKLS